MFWSQGRKETLLNLAKPHDLLQVILHFHEKEVRHFFCCCCCCSECIWCNFPFLVLQHKFWKHSFLMKHIFFCSCKFMAPQCNILQEQKMSETKKNKNGISERKNYFHSFFKRWDPSVCTFLNFLKVYFVQLYTFIFCTF